MFAKKTLSLILSAILLLSLFTVLPVSVYAIEDIKIEAEKADKRVGINLEGSSAIKNIESGDWARYDNIDFGNRGIVKASARVTAANTAATGFCTIYIDATDETDAASVAATGTKISELYITPSGGWNNYKNVEADAVSVTGVHNVYIVFSAEEPGNTSSICNMNWLAFEYMSVFADYSAVDAAKARYPKDPYEFTAETLKALDNAIAAVLPELPKNQQATVDGYAAAINAAVDGLEKKVLLKIEAESADERNGIDIMNGSDLNHIENGDWVKYAAVDFGSAGTYEFGARVALGSTGAPGYCNIYLDSTDEANKVASLYIDYTGDWNKYISCGTGCLDITGVHDVYMVFSSDSAKSICNMNWLAFSQNNVADYSAVDAAKAAVPADLSVYTDTSAKAVTDALAAVVPNLPKAGQETVDGYAADILAAVKALELKAEIAEKLDFSIDISDGVAVKGDDEKYCITWNAEVVLGDKTTLEKVNSMATFTGYGVYYGTSEEAVANVAAGNADTAKKLAFAQGDDVDVYTIFGFRLKEVLENRSRAAMFYITYEFNGTEYTVYSDCVEADAGI